MCLSVCLFVTGDAMNNFLNDNFIMIIQDLSQPANKALGMLVHQVVMAFMGKVPYDELFTKDD